MSSPVLRASVIVPTYKRMQFLQETIASLRSQVCAGGFEIIVVDNAPSVAVRSYTASFEGQPDPQVCYLPEPRVGLHHARHAGARAARSGILVYVDDDILAQPRWLEALLVPYQDAEVACVGGKSLARWGAAPPKWVSALHPGAFSLLDYGDDLRELQWPEVLYGCNFSIRKTALWEVGGFNPDGFGDRRLIWHRGDGETGLLHKIYAAGYKVVYAPRAVVCHRVPACRLTPAYARRRAFDQGISAGYSQYRDQRPGRPSLVLGAIGLALRCAYYGVLAGAGLACRDETRWVKDSYTSMRCRARMEFSLRLVADSRLRAHVLRDSYMNIDC